MTSATERYPELAHVCQWLRSLDTRYRKQFRGTYGANADVWDCVLWLTRNYSQQALASLRAGNLCGAITALNDCSKALTILYEKQPKLVPWRADIAEEIMRVRAMRHEIVRHWATLDVEALEEP